VPLRTRPTRAARSEAVQTGPCQTPTPKRSGAAHLIPSPHVWQHLRHENDVEVWRLGRGGRRRRSLLGVGPSVAPEGSRPHAGAAVAGRASKPASRQSRPGPSQIRWARPAWGCWRPLPVTGPGRQRVRRSLIDIIPWYLVWWRGGARGAARQGGISSRRSATAGTQRQGSSGRPARHASTHCSNGCGRTQV
jgi:hypothetical protein